MKNIISDVRHGGVEGRWEGLDTCIYIGGRRLML